MRVNFKGEADGLPCHAFGQEFPVGEWVEVEGAAAAKLSANPMFDAEGQIEAAEPDIAALRAQYVSVLGKKPFPGWSADVLREKLAPPAQRRSPIPKRKKSPPSREAVSGRL